MTSEQVSSNINSFQLPSLIAAVPYLLTFQPQDSVLMLWFDAAGQLKVTQRTDMPKGLDDDSILAWHQQALGHEVAVDSERVIFIFVPNAKTPNIDLTAKLCIEGVDTAQIAAAVITDFASFRYVGQQMVHTISVDDERKAAELFGVGLSERPVASRRDVEAEMAPRESISSRYMAFARRRLTQVSEHDSYEKWSDSVIASAVMPLLSGSALSNRQVADLTVWLEHIDERDRFVQMLAVRNEHLAIETLADVVARTPLGSRAPIATATAIYAYINGDGLRANIALDIALEDEPEFALAKLATAAIQRSVHPAEMRSTLTEVSEMATDITN
jgi:hypothetical protein